MICCKLFHTALGHDDVDSGEQGEGVRRRVAMGAQHMVACDEVEEEEEEEEAVAYGVRQG